MFINFSFQRTLQKFYLSQPVELTPLRNSFESHPSILSGHFLLLSHQYYLKTNNTVLNYIHDLLQLRVPIKYPSASRIIFKKQYNVCIQNMSGKNYCTQLFFSGKIFFFKKEMAEREQSLSVFLCKLIHKSKGKGPLFQGLILKLDTGPVTSIRMDSTYSTYGATLARIHLLSGEIRAQLYSNNKSLMFSFC